MHEAEGELNIYQAIYVDGDYGASIEIKSLKFVHGTGPEPNRRLLILPAGEKRHLTLQAEIEIRATRALREDEGVLIQRIASPGRPVDAARPIAIDIDIEDAVERAVAETPGMSPRSISTPSSGR